MEWNIAELNDRQLGLELVKAYKETSYKESVMAEAIARILNRLK